MMPNQFRRGPTWHKLDRFWAFHDDSDTTTAIDLSVNGQNGTISSGAYRNGPYGLALDADGSATEVSISVPAFSEAYTVMVWFTLDSPNDSDGDTILTARDNNPLRFRENGNGPLEWLHNGPTTTTTLSTLNKRNPDSGREYLAVMRWDGNTITMDMGSRKDSISPLHQVDSEANESTQSEGVTGRQYIGSSDGSNYLDGGVSAVMMSGSYLADDEVYWIDSMLNLIKAVA